MYFSILILHPNACTDFNNNMHILASVFGEQRRLEPMPPERKARWKKEIDWLLAVTDQIVVLVPTKQVHNNGTVMEVILSSTDNYSKRIAITILGFSQTALTYQFSPSPL
jgi:PRONE (Plant-specific Rop nucleotide exchanger)